MERKYYAIDERTARIAHDMMSFGDFQQGRLTKEYRGLDDKAYDLADKIAEAKPYEAEKAYNIADRYARRLAENINKDSSIGTRCPSVMICGPANFPVRKKEKQVAAWDSNMEERKKIDYLLTRLENILYGKEVIQSDDENALIRLQDKLDKLVAEQEKMKKVNAYYRKHKTLDDCPELTEEEILKLKDEMSKDWHLEDKPYRTWKLSNNNATIKNTKARLEKLQKVKEQGTQESDNKFFKVVENTEIMRLQLFFEGKPSDEVRSIVKGHGFKWAPSHGAWQRQLTNNAKYSLKKVIEELEKLER